jgi:hypothetical protein
MPKGLSEVICRRRAGFRQILVAFKYFVQSDMLYNHRTKPGTAIQCKTKDSSCHPNFLYLTIYYAIHNTSAQNLSKINAMINPLVVESFTVNNKN